MQFKASRRQLIRGGFCLCCCPRLGFAASDSQLQEVSPGVFVRRGPDAEASTDNRNGIANIGFIIGRDAVLVFDAGGSLDDGRWLRAQIRQRTDRPIRHVVISHVHPDHCFGVSAFTQDPAGAPPDIIGHHRLTAALQTRGAYYRQRLAALLGDAAVGQVVLPTREIGPAGATLDLGDRQVRCIAHATAHTDSDLSLLDSGSGLLFPSDLLFVGRLPSLDGSLRGWLQEAQHLRALGALRAVPGHGPAVVDFAPAMTDLERYLTRLRDDTRRAIVQNLTLDDAVVTVAQSERDHWALFDEGHGRNVTQAYQELEWE